MATTIGFRAVVCTEGSDSTGVEEEIDRCIAKLKMRCQPDIKRVIHDEVSLGDRGRIVGGGSYKVEVNGTMLISASLDIENLELEARECFGPEFEFAEQTKS